MANMLRISDAASLAMHTMVLLADHPDQVLSTGQIARTLAVSEAHLSKVLQRLHKAGVVRSIRGPRGGFVPDRPTDEVTLLEVYEAIEGPLMRTTCLLGKPVCDGSGCILGDLLTTVDGQIRAVLAGTRLSELAGKVRG